MKIISKDIVSFDIFDTLIKRTVTKPNEVFDIVESEFNKNKENKIKDFKKYRIEAEKECRASSLKEEITFDEIYEQLKGRYAKDTLECLKKIEINVEINVCKFNKEIKEVYDWCIKNNKRIIITSDMYLDRETICKILANNGISYEKLYLSSEIGLTKRSGSIFNYVLADLNIKRSQIIHIGDNKKSDFVSPLSKGIFAIKWKKPKILYSENITESLISGFLFNYGFDKSNYASFFGYNCFGPLLLCFSKWLLEEFKKNDIKNVFFLARDGFIMKKAFDIINTDEQIKTQYFYASRRALIVPSLRNCKNIEEMFAKMHIEDDIKPINLLKKLGLDEVVYEINFKKNYGVDIDKKLPLKYIFENPKYKLMFEDLYDKVVINAKNEYDSFLEYAKTNSFSGRVAIVDIGWYGNMQHAIESFGLDCDINGFYVGIEPRKNYQEQHKMKGFLFETNKHYDNFLCEHNFNSIFESLFLAQQGSVKRYNKGAASGIELYDYEYADSFEKEQIEKIQENALLFINDFKKANLLPYLTDELNVMFKYICSELLDPSLKVAEYFGDFKFLDDDDGYIAKPQKWYKYVNVKKFINDYKNASWRIGFLKRVFKIKLPYFKINMIIRKIFLNIK